MTFKHRLSLKRHVITHTQSFTIVCDECGTGFRSSRELTEHKHKHKGMKPNVCNICNKAFQYEYSLNRHLRFHSGETYDCTECDRKFDRPHGLKIHMETHMTERERSFICPVKGCGKSFYRGSDVNRHHKEVHLGMRKPKILKNE